MSYGLITYALDREPGGIGRYTIELLHGLRAAGSDITVLNAGAAGAPAGAQVLPGARLLPALLTLGQAEIAWFGRRLALLHDPTGVAPLLLSRARRVATIHDVIPYIYPETSSRLDWLIYRCWLPLAAKRLDAIITVSQQSKADIVRYLHVKSEDVAVIPEAANSAYREMSQAEIAPALARHNIDFPYILYVGSVEARKNLPRLLEAYAGLRNWLRQWKLVIVGARKWKFSPVFETVQRLGLEPYVHFTGYVEEADLPALYNGAALFAFPSLYEGFGLPVLEAMACGTPVVTSSSSSLPEVAGDAALLVDPYDIAALADAMRRVLEDSALAAALRVKGLERARQFTWERTARETIAVYERVLGRPVAAASAPQAAITATPPKASE
jgi:glycosyltransferase involved in cell wall biosynthesis